MNLTMPVECLLPIEVMSKTEAGRNTIYELNWLLTSCKEAFLDPKATRRIVDHIKMVLEYVSNPFFFDPGRRSLFFSYILLSFFREKR